MLVREEGRSIDNDLRDDFESANGEPVNGPRRSGVDELART